MIMIVRNVPRMCFDLKVVVSCCRLRRRCTFILFMRYPMAVPPSGSSGKRLWYTSSVVAWRWRLVFSLSLRTCARGLGLAENPPSWHTADWCHKAMADDGVELLFYWSLFLEVAALFLEWENGAVKGADNGERCVRRLSLQRGQRQPQIYQECRLARPRRWI